uniref:Phosphoglycolate phosphatase n=1 Tax=uncultured organism TaxID=155900 RepID=A0A068FQT6_9ZZZZ|nr:phosphoglycolate phosphatase [uncultured organism]
MKGDPRFPVFDTESAFAFYEASRQRLPQARFPVQAKHAASLIDIADHFDCFVFDAFGVLNVGDTPIMGSVEAVSRLRALGKQLFVVTNGASLPADRARAKFRRFGFDFSIDEIYSSRMPAEMALVARNFAPWGVMAPEGFVASQLAVPCFALGDDRLDYDAAQAFLLLSTLDWSATRQGLLEDSLSKKPRPVIVANPDVVAPHEHGLSTEPGYLAHRLVAEFGIPVEFHGKPFPSVFDLVKTAVRPGTDPRRICMIGDTLHTDVLGGAQAGWSSVLVSDHGLFRGQDTARFIVQSGIVPDWIIPSI